MDAMTAVQINFLAAYLMSLALFAVALVYVLWPASEQLEREKSPINVFGIKCAVAREQHLLLLVLLMGFIGGCAWALWFFAYNIATPDRGLKDAQFLWYILRPWTCALMTLIFYGLLRSGLMVVNVGHAKTINVYGLAGLAGAAGFGANTLFDKFSAIFQAASGGGH